MKKALIVIDMQNDFINGSLGTREAQAIVPNVAKLIQSSDYAAIFFTRDTHSKDYLDTQEGKNLPIEHCIRGTNGWKIHDDIAVASIESDMAGVIIDKPTFGAFDIADELAEGNYDEVDLVGLCTDICVITNALILKTQFPEMKINIIENATAGTTPEVKQAALTVAKSCQINII